MEVIALNRDGTPTTGHEDISTTPYFESFCHAIADMVKLIVAKDPSYMDKYREWHIKEYGMTPEEKEEKERELHEKTTANIVGCSTSDF